MRLFKKNTSITYLSRRPDAADSGQVSAKGNAPLLRRVAGRQVITRGNNTDSIRGPRKNSVFNLSPELVCARPRCGHDAKGVAILRHRHDPICKGAQVRRSHKKNKLEQKTGFLLV